MNEAGGRDNPKNLSSLSETKDGLTPEFSPIEFVWLNNISDPDASSKIIGVETITQDQIEDALKEIKSQKPVDITLEAQAILQQSGVSDDVTKAVSELLYRYRYDHPVKILRRITKFPVIVGQNKVGEMVAVLPEYHDAQGAGEEDFVYGNCATLAKHFAFQLHTLSLIDSIQNEASRKKIVADLTVNNGQCLDLFNNDGANHWFCVLKFKKGSESTSIVLDPSFQRITSDKGYTTFEKGAYYSDVNTADRETSVEYMPLDPSDLSFETIALSCSFNKRLSYGISFHEYENIPIPVLSVFWDNADQDGHSRCDIFLNPQTNLPLCDRSIIASYLSLPERVQVVQCLKAIQSFEIKKGDVQQLLDRNSLILSVGPRIKHPTKEVN